MFNVTFFSVDGRDMIEIKSPSDKHSSVIRKVTEIDQQTFEKEWEAYKTGGEIDWGGTPLTTLVADPTTGRKVEHSFAASMALKGIHNVEMLAALSDIAAQQMGMGIISLRKRAVAYVAEAQKAAAAAVAAQAAQAAPPEPVNMGTGRKANSRASA
jgi:hypothetical protein